MGMPVPIVGIAIGRPSDWLSLARTLDQCCKEWQGQKKGQHKNIAAMGAYLEKAV